MSLFQAIIDSTSNPQHAGSNSDLQGLTNLAQLIPGVQDTEQHVKPILDVLGPHLQDVLNNQQQTQGQAAAQQTVSNLSQPGVGVQELQNLLAGGTNQSDSQAPNQVLNSFLGGQNGGALLTEAFSLASQFMKR